MSAAPSGSGGVLPTRSEVEEWDTSDLANAATGWRSAATASEDLFDQHRQNISSPGGTTWEGDAKDAALSRVTADIGVVGSHGTVLREAAGIAENGVTDINAAKRDVLAAIAETEEDGFSVGEDLSVTDTRESDESTAGARQAAAAEHAEDIRWNAERLVAADAHVGQRLQAKAGELEGIKFEGEGEGRDGEGTIQLVDNKVQDKPPEDAKDKPQPPAEQATGQIGPFAVPKSVEDAAKKSDGKPTVTGDAGGDLGDLLGANDPPPEGKPADGQPAKPGEATPGGLPEVLGNVQPPVGPQERPQPALAAAPKLDPARVEEFKSATRPLLQQQGVPPDQIEQRLNEMVAKAQQPVAPYTPPTPEAMPKPGFGDGFGDAWRGLEDSVHRLTGQDGFENFKDAWKDLGTGVVGTAEDVIKDPYGTLVRGIADEFKAATDNPAYWAGQRAFDATAGAATLPFGGEGALARGVLDDVADAGIPHDVVDTPAPRHPAPVVEHHAPLPDVSVEHHAPDAIGTQIGEEVASLPAGGPSQTQTLADRVTALNLGQADAAQVANIASQRAFGATAGIATLPDGTKMVLPTLPQLGVAMQVSPDGAVTVFRGDLSQFLPYLG